MAAASETAVRADHVEELLRARERCALLRFTTAGSVDDGKSTLIGRLLYDAQALLEDHLAEIRNSRVNRAGGRLDFSLLTDGLRAEREQGITIDVAYRHFATPRRKFLIADTPGHEQYTRNMATGASTADLAVILVDARRGVLTQTRRHAAIAALLGIPRLVVAVNKMDLVGWSREVFEAVRAGFGEFLERAGVPAADFIPLSALEGDNVARRSPRMPWYEGPSLLEYLETAPLSRHGRPEELRFPVQYVNRPSAEFRGYSGRLAGGTLRPGEPVLALPSGRVTRVRSIVSWDGELAGAWAPMSVTVTLEDHLDLSRGDMLVDPRYMPHVSRCFAADVVWMSEKPLSAGAEYLLKHTTQQVRARIQAVGNRLEVDTLRRTPAAELRLNEIGAISVECHRPLFFDAYGRNRTTGAFILIDLISNATCGAGMIREPRSAETALAARSALAEVEYRTGRLTAAERYARLGHFPATVWLTARSELAHLLERRLFERGCLAVALTERSESGLLPELARVLHAAGAIAICSAAGCSEQERERARREAGAERFLEIRPAELPAGDEGAADRIIALLEQRGVLPLREEFHAGEGI